MRILPRNKYRPEQVSLPERVMPRLLAISVVVTFADPRRLAYLDLALQSVTGQSLAPHEVLLINDTREALDYKAVRTLPGPQQGNVAFCRNVGLKAARGDWIAFLDDDDLWAPRKLQRQAAAIGPGVAIVATRATLIDSHGSRVRRAAGPNGQLGIMDLLRENTVVFSSIMVNRQLLLQIGGFDTSEMARFCDDFDMYVAMTRLGSIVVVPEFLTLYRRHQLRTSEINAARPVTRIQEYSVEKLRTSMDQARFTQLRRVAASSYYLSIFVSFISGSAGVAPVTAIVALARSIILDPRRIPLLVRRAATLVYRRLIQVKGVSGID